MLNGLFLAMIIFSSGQDPNRCLVSVDRFYTLSLKILDAPTTKKVPGLKLVWFSRRPAEDSSRILKRRTTSIMPDFAGSSSIRRRI
jgi:hypothetical protein